MIYGKFPELSPMAIAMLDRYSAPIDVEEI
jgi:hypothetical protein